MKTLIIQHEPETPAGSTLQWLQQKNIPFTIVDAKTGSFPDPVSFNNLIICGGSMNVDEENFHPWLKKEKDFLKKCLNQNKNILGLCLGSQLMAEVLGATVQSMKTWEIGWYPVRLEQENQSPSFFHWHGYHSSLPAGAQLLAHSDVCAVQGFQWKSNVTGFQFHPEADEAWIDLALNGYQVPSQGSVQTSLEIRENTKKYLRDAEAWYFRQLDKKFL